TSSTGGADDQGLSLLLLHDPGKSHTLPSVHVGAARAANSQSDALSDYPWLRGAIGYHVAFKGTINKLTGRKVVSRRLSAGFTVLVVLASTLAAADKDVKARIVQVDSEKKTLTVSQEDGEKRYVFAPDAKVFSPTGAASKEGLKDKRLIAGAEVQLLLTAN